MEAEMRQQVFARLQECTGGKFEATFGEEQIIRNPEYNLKYATGPVIELVEQYNKLVDDANFEIDGLHRMLRNKKLDISKLSKENNKFLIGA